MSYRISLRIEMVCKHLNIPYHSPYLEKSNFHEDALQLRELYLQLKQVVGSIVEIADKHGGEPVADELWRYVTLIEGVDHNIAYMAKAMDGGDKDDSKS